jgi:hypothetical protein
MTLSERRLADGIGRLPESEKRSSETHAQTLNLPGADAKLPLSLVEAS